MGLTIWQVILITVIAYIQRLDFETTQIITMNYMFWSCVVGALLGDFQMGLIVGATIQLMSLGVAALGGSSTPDYAVAAIISTTVAITTGKGMAAGLALGIPVGMICIQLDVLLKIINSFITNKAHDLANKRQYRKMRNLIPVMTVLMPLESAIPVFIAVLFGKTVVSSILNFMPAWFTVGLNVAGGMLPAVGMAMLLTYMPLKKYGYWLLIGFALTAYLKMPVLGVALIGTAGAIPTFMNHSNRSNSLVTTTNGMTEEDMEDE
ncbi:MULTISPECIES: PTS sugar transporter subunit IIC [unclassified Lactobacillus]|uniref:PTS mannose/fructose/sorbose/N-acetylgalactosamine transporter subunit IIC n=1 Tax=unclassified Lactobacillus TaxID=2620435 RepID=UPI000EFB4D6A|nr:MULTISPECIES: PTS sugar transporter subunit IIC [unclassified Lactobacillus]RMC23500.1 PTS sugar transporter subunit IIC [Lactobacillus sp. ESL0247]RMC27297.1 PTS sugar transporter subunit IIC [Lactobacillus sp. ESL0246]RMC30362.1 PTS sugar transporter subunit IIC [Lactobacillus sp. ESL0245]